MPADPKLRNVPTDAPTGLFRLIERQLRADPDGANAVKTWRTWEGKPDDKLPPSIGQLPWVRLTPRAGPLEFWAASTMTGWLFVELEVALEGTCVDDLFNLWGLLKRACYPADSAARLLFQARLRDAGAHTGLVKFSHPVLDDGAPDGSLSAGRGWVAVEYRFDQNPTAPGF